MEEEASAELISPRISFSHDLATFAAAATTCPTTPSRSDTSSFLMSRRRRRLPAEPEFDFANAAADDVAPADRLFADGKLLPVPPLPPTPPHARLKQPQPTAWQQKATTRPVPTPTVRSWASPFARSSSVNSAATAASSGGRFTCPAFPLMRSQSAGHRPHSKKVAPATAATTTAGVHNGGARSVYYYGYRGSRNGSASGGVRVSPVLNVTSIGTSVVNMLSYLLCDCGEIKGAKSRGVGVSCWVTR
ncbi:uncharacterized protein LOC124664449 [Lolium rigidum]|uniref:uncharacterized protein LOC124664449 n=1 Tax=Lolium rigidum TaxID=89674 RepID=UPI001F5D2EE5|nr:uncharacterized protein LOC124664449 [Lolium rigidum]